MASGLENIWENWRHGSGPCNECPMRDSSHKWSPYFADGVEDADIAIIAETPGQGSTPRPTQHAQFPDLTTAASLKEKQKRRNSMNTNTDDPIGEISFPIINHNRIPRKFFEIINGTFRVDRDNRRRIYYTNSKKCKDVSSDDEKWKNDKGYIHCRSYIRPELEWVSPDIVLPLGDHATNLTFHELDAEWTGKLKSEIPIDFENGLQPLPADARKIGEYHVIPSYHWSYINQSKYTKEDYWKSLAEVIVSVA